MDKSLEKNNIIENAKTISSVLAKLQIEEENQLIILDLFSPKEIERICKRIKVSEYINKGYTYSEIIKEVGISTATINRIRDVYYNGNGGLEILVKKYLL